MENLEVTYENLQVGTLYVYSHRDNRSKEILMLYKNPIIDIHKFDEEIISYIPQKTPFMVLEKSVCDNNQSYFVMWTDENTETVMGWIRHVDVVSEDYKFFVGCEANTVDYTDEVIAQCKEKYRKQLLIWQATVGGS